MRNAVIFHHLGAGNADEDALRVIEIDHGAHVKINGQHAKQNWRAFFDGLADDQAREQFRHEQGERACWRERSGCARHAVIREDDRQAALDGDFHFVHCACVHHQRTDRVEVRNDERLAAEVAVKHFEHLQNIGEFIFIRNQQDQRLGGVGNMFERAVEIGQILQAHRGQCQRWKSHRSVSGWSQDAQGLENFCA